MKNSLYRTRKEAMNGCIAEAKAAEKYTNSAIRFAEAGKSSTAWDMADVAKSAAVCAMQAHDALWTLSGGNLTAEEFEAFEQAEIAQTNALKAAQAAAQAVRDASR